MTVANTEVILRQTRTKIDTLKPTILSLLLKNEKEDKKSYETLPSLHVEDKLLSKHHIIITKKLTKIVLSTHKLHSLHPFI